MWYNFKGKVKIWFFKRTILIILKEDGDISALFNSLYNRFSLFWSNCTRFVCRSDEALKYFKMLIPLFMTNLIYEPLHKDPEVQVILVWALKKYFCLYDHIIKISTMRLSMYFNTTWFGPISYYCFRILKSKFFSTLMIETNISISRRQVELLLKVFTKV